jgi:GAF domain-containing protein
LRILDTTQDIAFDRITEAASTITHSPIALVSLVDGHRQWFKSRVGLDVSETSRDLAFCSHVIAQSDDKLFVVCDALEDERFKYSDLVLGGPHIRFYAGVPLIVQDDNGCRYKIGTLCIIDRIPRNLEDFHYPILESLAGLVVTEIDKLRGRPHEVIDDGSANLVPSFDFYAPLEDSYNLPIERAHYHDGELATLAGTEAMWKAILAGHQSGPVHPAPRICSSWACPSSVGQSSCSSFFSDADEDLWRSSSDAEDGDPHCWTDPALAGLGGGAQASGDMDWDSE